MKRNDTISIIIPSYNSLNFIKKLLINIDDQKLKPNEVIIIDEDKKNLLENLIKNNNFNLNIKHIKYKGNSYPGNKRNLGVRIAQSNIVAFLDVKTIPKKDWLHKSYKIYKEKKLDIVFGSTKYFYNNFFQKITLFSTYGNICHETTPGSLFSKEFFLKVGDFIENVRAGDDLEWRERIKIKKYNFFTPEENNLSYSELPNNILRLGQKYIYYSIDNSFVIVQNKIKNFYLILLLILSALIIPKWNYIIPNWSNSVLYAPNITKIYVISLTSIFLFYSIFNLFIISKRKNNNSFFNEFFLYFILVVFFFSAYYWNRTIADGIDYGAYYVPHITKTYVSILIFSSILYRGILNPLSRKVEKKDLFPFLWIIVGFNGLFLDIVKAPGYIIGSIFTLFLASRTKKII